MTLVTSLIFLSPHKKITKPNITQPLKNGDVTQFLAITQVWDLIETWGFRVDDHSDFPDIPISPHKKFTKSNITKPLKYGNFCSFLAITPVWDLIETWDFRVDDPCDFPDITISPHKKITKPNITQPLKNGDFCRFWL